MRILRGIWHLLSAAGNVSLVVTYGPVVVAVLVALAGRVLDQPTLFLVAIGLGLLGLVVGGVNAWRQRSPESKADFRPRERPNVDAPEETLAGGSQVVIYKSVTQLRNEGRSLSQGQNSGIMLNSLSAQLEMRLSNWTKDVKDALKRDGASDHQVKLFVDAGKPVSVGQGGLNLTLGAPYELAQKLNVLNAYLHEDRSSI